MANKINVLGLADDISYLIRTELEIKEGIPSLRYKNKRETIISPTECFYVNVAHLIVTYYIMSSITKLRKKI